MSEVLETKLRPDWTEMERVNEVAHEFLERCGLSDDLVDTFTMVACELVENGIKYGDAQPGPAGALELHVSVAETSITVQVRNRITPGSRHHLRQLDQTLQWIRGFQDPFQAYIERLKQIAREPTSQRRSGLGIVRIAYEARAAIDFVMSEADSLSVSAVAKVADQEGL
jgi:hypothetical protein